MATSISRKAALRRDMRHVLSRMMSEDREAQSARVQSTLTALEVYAHCRHVAAYLHTREEVHTDTLLGAVWHSQRTLYLPRVRHRDCGLMDMVACTPHTPLVTWAGRIRQPSPEQPSVDLTSIPPPDSVLVIVPGLAFSPCGEGGYCRLGRGSGYYDRLLAQLRRAIGNRLFTVGVAYRQQVVSDLPTESCDQIIEQLITS